MKYLHLQVSVFTLMVCIYAIAGKQFPEGDAARTKIFWRSFTPRLHLKLVGQEDECVFDFGQKSLDVGVEYLKSGITRVKLITIPATRAFWNNSPWLTLDEINKARLEGNDVLGLWFSRLTLSPPNYLWVVRFFLSGTPQGCLPRDVGIARLDPEADPEIAFELNGVGRGIYKSYSNRITRTGVLTNGRRFHLDFRLLQTAVDAPDLSEPHFLE